MDSGDIYKGTHSGWYSISDECFYSPSQITRTGDGKVIATETGNEVILEEEENWKFRLTGYKERLRDWLSKPECELARFGVREIELRVLNIARSYMAERLSPIAVTAT